MQTVALPLTAAHQIEGSSEDDGEDDLMQWTRVRTVEPHIQSLHVIQKKVERF